MPHLAPSVVAPPQQARRQLAVEAAPAWLRRSQPGCQLAALQRAQRRQAWEWGVRCRQQLLLRCLLVMAMVKGLPGAYSQAPGVLLTLLPMLVGRAR